MKCVWMAMVAVALAGCSKSVAPPPEVVESKALDNGLQVVVKPLEGAQTVALVVLYSVGGKHDPEDASGMAHLIEHLYVTAAAGERKARDIDAYLEAYPEGWNAQTGDDYTVIATVFPRAKLKEELADAAARMTALDLTPADLKREIPRLEVELANMYGAVPTLAVQNLAAQAVDPPLAGARFGGVPEQVERISIEALQQRLATLYKPRNATLVLAGDLDAAEAEAMIAEAFGKIPGGEPVAEPDRAREPKNAGTVELDVSRKPGSAPYAALAYKAPAPSSEDYAPFLALLTHLQTRAYEFGTLRQPSAVQFAPLDRPEVLTISAPALEGEEPQDAVGRLERLAARIVEEAPIERELISNSFGFLLGLGGTDAVELALNPYGVAFGIARRRQLGLDPVELAKRINDLNEEDLARVRKSVFAQDATGRALARTSAPRG